MCKSLVPSTCTLFKVLINEDHKMKSRHDNVSYCVIMRNDRSKPNTKLVSLFSKNLIIYCLLNVTNCHSKSPVNSQKLGSLKVTVKRHFSEIRNDFGFYYWLGYVCHVLIKFYMKQF